MAHHHHEDTTGAGFMAGMSATMFMLIGLVLLILVLALFMWQPWADTTSDRDVGGAGGVIEETLPGGGGADDGDNGGGNDTGGGAAPGSYRFGAGGMPSVVAANAALTRIDWTPQDA